MNDIDQFIAAHSTAAPAPGAPAQGPEERPVALRPGPAQGDRRLPGRVRRPGERLPGPRRPPGAAQPARPPQARLSPGADPGHAAARRAGRLDGRAAGAAGALGQAAGAGCGPTCRSGGIPGPDPVPRVPPALARPGPVHAGGRHRLGPEDRLVVTGRANVPSIDIPRRRNTSKIVVLRRRPGSGGSRSCCPSGRSCTRRPRRCPSRTGTTTTGRVSGSRSAPGGSAGPGSGSATCSSAGTASGARPGCTPRCPAPRSGRGRVRWHPACGSAPAGPVSA